MIETRGWNASLGSDLCNACSQTRRKLMSLKVTRGEEALILLQQEMRRYLILSVPGFCGGISDYGGH